MGWSVHWCHNLRKRLTIGNIYRTPQDNNNNKNIETLINEMSPITDKLKNENGFAVIAGDFNTNLLQINEREKYDDVFDKMCTNCQQNFSYTGYNEKNWRDTF